MWLRLALPTWVLVAWSRLLPFPKARVAFPPYPVNNPPHMWYLPQVAFPKPRVALAQQAHMQYSPHVAFLQPQVAFPQIHYPPHMRY